MRSGISALVFGGVMAWASVSVAQSLPSLEAASPLTLSGVDVGVGVRAGDAMAVGSYSPAAFPGVVEAAPHAVWRLQAWDEAAASFGEFITYPAPTGVASRTPVEFTLGNAPAGGLAVRADDLAEEIDEWAGQASAGAFASTTIVVDFWRYRRDWWVRWDGKLDSEANKVGQGSYGFYRKEMVDDLLNDIEVMVQTHQPRYLVVGHELERLLATETTGGVAPAELSNFMAFYQDVVRRVRSVSPGTKVGAGFEWERFVRRVSPLYGVAEDGVTEAAVDRAFQAVILPFVERGDIVALSSYGGGDDVHFQYLRRLEDRFGVTAPVVYYSVGAPVESMVAYQEQRTYLEDFLEQNAGVNVALVAWTSMINLDGADTNDQVVTGRCAAFTGPERALETPVSFCFDGLLDSVFSAKPVMEFLQAR